jgi:RimJ/RimL family protein N-acetyltransferase
MSDSAIGEQGDLEEAEAAADARSWLRMRPLRDDDVESVAEWFESPADLAMFTARQPVPMAPEALRRSWTPIIEGHPPITSWFFVVEDSDAALVAFAGIEDVNLIHGTAITPLWVARPARSTGIGVVVRAAMLDLAFDSLGLHRVTSMHRSDNLSSRRVNELCGLSPEGAMRQAWRDGDERVDISVWGILAAEWRAGRRELARSLPVRPEVRFGDDERTAWPAAARR